MSAIPALLSPLSYLRIKHPLKKTVDFGFPIWGGAISVGCISLWSTFNLFGSSGLAVGVNGLVQILSGFFITSLAAIATFNGKIYRIDEIFDGEKATLDDEVLTRRQFLCFLFSYLALSSLILYLCGAISISAASTLHASANEVWRYWLRIAFCGGYFSLLAHVIGTTLIGLIFLSGRVPGTPSAPRYVAGQRKSGTDTHQRVVTAASSQSKPEKPGDTALHQ